MKVFSITISVLFALNFKIFYNNYGTKKIIKLYFEGKDLKLLLKKVLLCMLVVFCHFGCSVNAYDSSKKVSLGLGYPYISLKYGVSSHFAIEIRNTTEEGIQIIGGRIYYNVNPFSRSVLYYGIEGDNISFSYTDQNGTGFAGYVFIGEEYFLNKTISLNLDIGPTYTKVIDESQSSIAIEGVDWVANLGLNLYF